MIVKESIMRSNLTGRLVTPIGIAILLALGTPAAAAERKDAGAAAEQKTVYKTVDSQGRPVFTDQASEDAQAVKLEEPMTFPGKAFAEDYGRFTAASPNETTDTGPAYSVMEITSPGPDEAIRNNPGNISISYRISPALQPGHLLQLMMDGAARQPLSGGKMIELENVDRGTHTVHLRVIDRETGEEIQAGPPVSFTILRHSILSRPPS
jgi:hypothetical protein